MKYRQFVRGKPAQRIFFSSSIRVVWAAEIFQLSKRQRMDSFGNYTAGAKQKDRAREIITPCARAVWWRAARAFLD